MKQVCGFAVSHIVTHYYTALHRLVWSVGLSVALSVCHTSEPCKKAETIKLPFGFWTRVGPMNHVLHEVQMPTWEEEIWGGNRQAIVEYWDTPRSSVQTQLSRSRCRLCSGLTWALGIMCYTGIQIPHLKVQFWWLGAPVVNYRHFLS